jgi:phosphatidylinositol phospholipase C, delta
VIKGRRPDGSLDDFESDDESEDDELASNNESNAGTEKTTRTNATNSSSQTARSKNIKIKISPSLARLTLFHGCKHKSWDISVRNPTHHMHSFSENKVKKLCRQNKGKKWAIYNQSHMSRTYPAGSRVDSSNYNPTLAWSTGCQMVALNFQTPDPPLKINDGRFRENGNCGYVRKPEAILPRENLLQNSKCLKLSVRVLSGSCLPKPKGHSSGDCIDPYVKVTVHDVKNEEKDISSSYTTSIVQKNGYFPIWHNATNRDRFVFLIENYAVAIIQFEVFTKGDIGQADEFISHAAIPISCLRQGYRSVQLFDECNTRRGPFDFACLLVEIKIRQVSEP